MAVEIIAHIERVKDSVGKEELLIRGTRITVQEIMTMHVVNHSPIEWIVENYPLTHAQIYAALAYYYDHQAEIDRLMAESAVREHELTQNLPTLDDLQAKIKARGSNQRN